MNPHVIAAFARELIKVADGAVIQNHPDQPTETRANPNAGFLGRQAVVGAAGLGMGGLAAGGSSLGNRTQTALLKFHEKQLLDAGEKDLATRWHENPNGVRGYVEGKRIGFGSPEEMAAIEDFRTKNAPNARVFHGDKAGWRAHTKAPSTVQPTASFHPESGAIYADVGAHPATLAHEVGHASGWQGLNRRAHLTERLLSAVSSGKAPAAIGALGTVGALSMAKNPEEQDRNLRYARNATLATGALALPHLAEEARASINAVRMGRNAGRGMEYAKHLLPAFGTYAVKPIGAIGGAALGVEGLRRYLKSRNAKATAESKS
jgi:hypothetical protein